MAADRDRRNEEVMTLAKDATGIGVARTPKAWRDALAARVDKYATQPKPRKKPIYDELVALQTNPNFASAFYETMASLGKVTYVDS